MITQTRIAFGTIAIVAGGVVVLGVIGFGLVQTMSNLIEEPEEQEQASDAPNMQDVTVMPRNLPVEETSPPPEHQVMLPMSQTSPAPAPTDLPPTEPTLGALPTPMEVRILSLRYFPDEDNDGNLDVSITGIESSVKAVRERVDELMAQSITAYSAATKYHGYKNSSAGASLQYSVFDDKEFLQTIPVSNNEIPWKPGQGVFRPDYKKMLQDVDVCDYVDNKRVRQVWIWGYHYGNIEPTESNMAMGILSQDYWNHGSYGDVSNSEQTNDLPVCANTYTIYNFNYQRGLAETMENLGHQIEAVLKFVDYDLFWNKFVGPYGSQSGERRCGWTHYAPNGINDYDWQNEADVFSDCEDWRPDGDGQKKVVDCHTWHGATCADDGGTNFKRWWLQNIPGKDLSLEYQGRNLRNWWEFVGDFDKALQLGKSLTY